MRTRSFGVIETRYRGYSFRSRLEARWALFLDCMEEAWEYEKEGFHLSNGVDYLPDFWLPRLQLWIEIKGQAPSGEELALCEQLRDDSNNAVAIFHGLPCVYLGRLFCWDLNDSSGGSSAWDAAIYNTGYGELCLFVETTKGLYSDALMQHELENDSGSVKVDIAAEFAKAARFEHGQEPNAEDCWRVARRSRRQPR